MKQNPHTYDMGVIGNCSYMAYVNTAGSIKWLCWPQPDSSFVFGGLLDPDKGGEFSVKGTDGARPVRQYYIRNTNVLETHVATGGGLVKIVDCAPRFEQYGRNFRPLVLVRKIEPLEGYPQIAVRCQPTYEHGAAQPEVNRQSNHIRYDFGQNKLRLNTNIPLSYIFSERSFVLNEPKYLVLTWGIPFEAELEPTAEDYIRETTLYWQNWVRGCSIGRFYQSEVIRSALVLKMHQFEDTGAILASGTTSLPEHPKTGRNWDYRYCWLRDAYYTLSALNQISQFEETKKFASFIENYAATDLEHYPPVVRLDGTFTMDERILNLAGYDGHGSVRVGNQAAAHVQNDIYGQIIFALLTLHVDERLALPLRQTSRRLIMTMLRRIDQTLGRPDATIWEFRDFSQVHGYTSLFHWVGSKAATKLARHCHDHEMLRAATRLVVRSAKQVEACYNPQLQAYAQEPGSTNMDASLLQLITLHFLDPESERSLSHVNAMEAQLKDNGGLFYRYKHQDDFGLPKSSFLVCAFWYVEALAAMGRVDDALKTLDSLLNYTNHLGLMSEDVDATTGSQWGNFPQTYSHVGLMNAVSRISSQINYPGFF